MFKDFFWKTGQDTRCIVFFSKKFKKNLDMIFYWKHRVLIGQGKDDK